MFIQLFQNVEQQKTAEVCRILLQIAQDSKLKFSHFQDDYTENSFFIHRFAKRIYSTNAKPLSEIPSSKGLPLVGSLFSFIAAGGGPNLHKYIDKRHQQLGIIFQEKIGPISSIFLNDASEIRKVFANEGRYPKHVLPECWLLYNKTKNFERGLYFM